MLDRLRRLFVGAGPRPEDEGGHVALYVHRRATLVLPYYRFRRSDGVFFSMVAMPLDQGAVLSPETDPQTLGAAILGVFAKIETVRAKARQDQLRRAVLESGDLDASMRARLNLSRSARLWPEMSLVSISAAAGQWTLRPNRTLRGSAFEGLGRDRTLHLDTPVDPAVLGKAAHEAIGRCE